MAMPPFPPNVDPSRYVAPPPPPRRPRPSGWWFVLLEPHEQKMLWAQQGDPASCTLVDRTTGAKLPTSGPGAEFTRSGGDGSWIGTRRFDSGSGQLEVTCDASAGPAQIGPAPQFGSFVGGIFAAILVPLVLGLLGLLVLIVTGALWAAGAPRTASGNNSA